MNLSENLGLSEQTKNNLLKIGYVNLTDIQKKVIPLALEGKDIVGQSNTGTGKTASFILPIFERLEKTGFPQILILVPTRELAIQVSEEAKKLAFGNHLNVLAIYGGEQIGKQLNALRKGVDVIVGTPGRVLDHLKRKSFQIKGLKKVVLDEADEMISRGFLEDIKKIMKDTCDEKQVLLFSATITSELKLFAKKFLKAPEYVVSENKEQKNQISHYFLETSEKKKETELINFLSKSKKEAIIVFANTKWKVEKIKESLSNKTFKTDRIHSDLSQRERIKVLDKFRNKSFQILIATDIAARGIDIKDISYVVNYDFPQSNEFYVHRVGRTGRRGQEGKAITFIGSLKEKKKLFKISNINKYRLQKV